MTKLEYLATQQQLLLIAGIVRDLDLQGFLAQIGRADALGPVLDPTLYRAGERPMAKIKRLAEAAQAMQRVAREMDGPEA